MCVFMLNITIVRYFKKFVKSVELQSALSQKSYELMEEWEQSKDTCQIPMWKYFQRPDSLKACFL